MLSVIAKKSFGNSAIKICFNHFVRVSTLKQIFDNK